jgi:hypothetical protein
VEEGKQREGGKNTHFTKSSPLAASSFRPTVCTENQSCN